MEAGGGRGEGRTKKRRARGTEGELRTQQRKAPNIGPSLSRLNAMPAKVAKKLLWLFLPVEICLPCSHKSTELFCVWVKTASFTSLAPN